MANFNKKNWLSVGESGANDNNSVLSKENMNDLENRIFQAFEQLDSDLKYETITSGDFDDLVGDEKNRNYPKKYYISTIDMKNQPHAHYGWLTYFYQTVNTQIQIFFTNDVKMFARHKNGGVWAEWVEFQNK